MTLSYKTLDKFLLFVFSPNEGIKRGFRGVFSFFWWDKKDRISNLWDLLHEDYPYNQTKTLIDF